MNPASRLERKTLRHEAALSSFTVTIWPANWKARMARPI